MKTIKDLEEFCTAVQYEYSLKDKSITKYELYGDLILSDDIYRLLLELE